MKAVSGSSQKWTVESFLHGEMKNVGIMNAGGDLAAENEMRCHSISCHDEGREAYNFRADKNVSPNLLRASIFILPAPHTFKDSLIFFHHIRERGKSKWGVNLM